MGGAFILRGRSGRRHRRRPDLPGPPDVVLRLERRDGLAHRPPGDRGRAPLAAIPLYLVIDWTVRRETSESAPTGLLA